MEGNCDGGVPLCMLAARTDPDQKSLIISKVLVRLEAMLEQSKLRASNQPHKPQEEKRKSGRNESESKQKKERRKKKARRQGHQKGPKERKPKARSRKGLRKPMR